MIRIVSGTVLFKFLTALVNFAVVAIISKSLGAEGKGVTTIFIANITINLLVSNIIGGTALVYLSSRKNILQLLIPAYAWTIIACSVTSYIIDFSGLSHKGLLPDLLTVSVLQGLFIVNTYLSVGREKISQVNLLNLIQIVLLATFLFSAFNWWGPPSIDYFITGLKLSFLIAFILSFFPLLSFYSPFVYSGFSETFKELFKYGVKGQFSNIIQFFNYRINYYILGFLLGDSDVGIFSVGVALGEAIWILGRSIGTVQYSQISNRQDSEYAKLITFKLVRVSFYGTLVSVLLLLLLPESFFSLIFGKDFTGAALVILTLAPGILSFGTAMTLSHYFAGLGKYHINNFAAIIGFAAVLLTGYYLTYLYGIIGAGVSMSLSYISSSLFYFYKFYKATGFTGKDLIPSKQDFRNLNKLIPARKL